MCLSYFLIRRCRRWVLHLNWIQKETKSHVQLLACTPLQPNTHTMGHIVLDLTSLAYQPMTKSREWSGHPRRHVTFAVTEQNLAYPAHTRDLQEDEDNGSLVHPDHTVVSGDEDGQPLVRPASRKELVKEKCDPAADHRIPARVGRRKGPPMWQDPTVALWQNVSVNSRERSKDVSILGRKAEGEALCKIINKLSDERNLRVLHLRHYHMSTAQFKKRTTHLDIPGKVYDHYQDVLKTCPFCNSTKPRPESSRVSGLRAEEFGDLIFFWSWIGKVGDRTFGFLIVMDGTMSHLTAFPCKRTSPSWVISKLHE